MTEAQQAELAAEKARKARKEFRALALKEDSTSEDIEAKNKEVGHLWIRAGGGLIHPADLDFSGARPRSGSPAKRRHPERARTRIHPPTPAENDAPDRSGIAVDGRARHPGGARGHFPGVNRPPKVPERVRGVPERGSCTFPLGPPRACGVSGARYAGKSKPLGRYWPILGPIRRSRAREGSSKNSTNYVHFLEPPESRAGECRASSRVDPDGLGGSRGSRGSRRSGASGAL